jgi:hypothetical protein
MSNGDIFLFCWFSTRTSSDSAFKKWLVMYFPSLLLYNGLRNTNSQWVEHFHHQLLLLLHSHIQTTSDRNGRPGTGSRKQGSGNPPRSHHFSTANSKSYRDDSLTTSALAFSLSLEPSPPRTRIGVQRPSKPSAFCTPYLFRRSWKEVQRQVREAGTRRPARKAHSELRCY